jgi:hypothetical protein
MHLQVRGLSGADALLWWTGREVVTLVLVTPQAIVGYEGLITTNWAAHSKN